MDANKLYMFNIPSVFVNGRSRAAIVDDMQARIERGDIQLERIEAIDVGHRYFFPLKYTMDTDRANRQCVILLQIVLENWALRT